jgi:putative membrane protein
MNRLKTAIILMSAALTLPGITSCGKSGVEASREGPLTDAKILSIDDKEFLKAAERSLVLQRTGAEIAMTKSTDTDVREIARQVANERRQDLAKLNALVQQKDPSMPPATAEELQLEVIHRLHGLTGSALDHEFISLLAAEQQQCVRIFDRAQTAADPDIRKFAIDVLPRLQKDFDKVAGLQTKLGNKKF